MNLTAMADGLTLAAFILVICQFLGKKGTKQHILRWYLVMIFSVTSITLNTIATTMRGPLVWDLKFTLHVSLGIVFFMFMGALFITGKSYIKHGESSSKSKHGLFACLTLTFMVLSVAIPLVRLFG